VRELRQEAPMDAADTRRRLMWHGILLFLLGLLAGIPASSYANPRMGLSAHVGGILTGLFLGLLGLIWTHLRFTARAATATFWLMLYGNYLSFAGLVLAAIFGTTRSTPLHGTGRLAAPWQETLVDFTLTSSALAALTGCVLLLWGLRGRAVRTA
jgi:hydroxylaminobenzene mutase